MYFETSPAASRPDDKPREGLRRKPGEWAEGEQVRRTGVWLVVDRRPGYSTGYWYRSVDVYFTRTCMVHVLMCFFQPGTGLATVYFLEVREVRVPVPGPGRQGILAEKCAGLLTRKRAGDLRQRATTEGGRAGFLFCQHKTTR